MSLAAPLVPAVPSRYAPEYLIAHINLYVIHTLPTHSIRPGADRMLSSLRGVQIAEDVARRVLQRNSSSFGRYLESLQFLGELGELGEIFGRVGELGELGE